MAYVMHGSKNHAFHACMKKKHRKITIRKCLTLHGSGDKMMPKSDRYFPCHFILCCHKMIPGPKGHAFHACMKKHDLLTRKTPKSSHFS